MPDARRVHFQRAADVRVRCDLPHRRLQAACVAQRGRRSGPRGGGLRVGDVDAHRRVQLRRRLAQHAVGHAAARPRHPGWIAAHPLRAHGVAHGRSHRRAGVRHLGGVLPVCRWRGCKHLRASGGHVGARRGPLDAHAGGGDAVGGSDGVQLFAAEQPLPARRSDAHRGGDWLRLGPARAALRVCAPRGRHCADAGREEGRGEHVRAVQEQHGHSRGAGQRGPLSGRQHLHHQPHALAYALGEAAAVGRGRVQVRARAGLV
mmetsp:Transcript_57869/g.136130  ORF Transcript_57869/g.136130 Transcript_57869/m.136130 type:complete len:261 (-) Transcript_57869:712-1494(-)